MKEEREGGGNCSHRIGKGGKVDFFFSTNKVLRSNDALEVKERERETKSAKMWSRKRGLGRNRTLRSHFLQIDVLVSEGGKITSG